MTSTNTAIRIDAERVILCGKRYISYIGTNVPVKLLSNACIREKYITLHNPSFNSWKKKVFMLTTNDGIFRIEQRLISSAILTIRTFQLHPVTGSGWYDQNSKFKIFKSKIKNEKIKNNLLFVFNSENHKSTLTAGYAYLDYKSVHTDKTNAHTHKYYDYPTNRYSRQATRRRRRREAAVVLNRASPYMGPKENCKYALFPRDIGKPRRSNSGITVYAPERKLQVCTFPA